ncbi:transposase [Halomicroarcula sp. GCM10025709]
MLDALSASHREWPYSDNHDTVNDPWPLAWDAAAFIEEWFAHSEHNDLEEAICYLPLNPWKFGYDITTWHDKKEPQALLRAHLLRIVKGWSGETNLIEYLEDEPELVESLGFEDGCASKSTLWRVWNDSRLELDHKRVIWTIGQVLVNVARENDVPAPEEVFHPDPSVDDPGDVEQDDSTVRDRTIANTREVWEHAKPMLTENYSLSRGDNAEVHENAFWESHAYMGSRAEMYAEDGTRNFAAETTRDRVQTGSTHRHHIQKINPEEARQMHRDTTEALIERARRDSELVGGVLASIDITKSNPYRENTELEFDEDGLANTWLLGYKEKGKDEDDLPDLHFQWASIQIVGLDVPLVLDAIPVSRGLSRAAIVDELLSKATDMIDIEMVMMDREFAHDPVKDVCEDRGVYYLNPGMMHTSERATCTRLRRQGKLVHIEQEEDSSSDNTPARTTLTDFTEESTETGVEAGQDAPARKSVYVPAMKAKRTADDSDDEEQESKQEDESQDSNEYREGLLSDFAEATEEDEESAGRMFGDLIEEIREEEEERRLPGNDEDTRLYLLFETNHPDLQPPDDSESLSEVEKAHMVSRIIRKYKYRWGIENGFKQIKRFRVRTMSMKFEYRFFNFLYACTMYNAWRLVDLLVKLELLADSEFRFKPLVTADLFLTIAKDYAGLDPPD